MAKGQEDKVQIGLTPVGERAIQVLFPDLFSSQVDAYRFAISYAIRQGLDMSHAPTGGYTTKYSAQGTLESGTSLRDLLEILEIGDPSRPYATAEKLAEIGLCDLARRLEGNESLADILEEATGGVPAVNEANSWPHMAE